MKIIKKTHAVRLAFLLSGFFAATLPLQAQPLPQDFQIIPINRIIHSVFPVFLFIC